MTQTTIDVIKMFFNVAYSFMTSFRLPGTQTTPLMLTMFALFAVVTWKMIKKMLNMGVVEDR